MRASENVIVTGGAQEIQETQSHINEPFNVNMMLPSG